ncbi:hypothetical protein DPMN_104188 [Dreissena polymorpha]|uniref:Uncharacterized protein n=1 Tax=Dreissena polymorpha TaxID=45954 RepID=A0A9D4K0X6_DREPO|nr:hypothetical protein DPMN_104188 [Dreissena polymorpha]
MVLQYLEQLLTPGGGWQDQVGGLLGGVQRGVSGAGLPVYVEAQDLQVDPDVFRPSMRDWCSSTRAKPDWPKLVAGDGCLVIV